MIFPSLPTDNLYKFMVIIGIIVVFYSLSVPIYFIHNIRSKLTELSIERSILSVELQYLNRGLELEYGKKVNQIAWPKLTTEQRQKYKDVDIRSVKLEELTNELTWKTQTMYLYMVFSAFGAIGGFFVAKLGFQLWYDKLQKYQDLIIQNEAGKFIPHHDGQMQEIDNQDNNSEEMIPQIAIVDHIESQGELNDDMPQSKRDENKIE